MKNGVFSMTLKQNISPLNGKLKYLVGRMNFNCTKTRVKCFFYYKGLICQSSFPNQTFYIKILRHLQDAIRRKRPEKWCNYIYLTMLIVTVL